jgi:serine/threonine-protein kinase
MSNDQSFRGGTLAAARVGTTLKGKWRLDAVLGVGGTATVYAATHRNGGRVAVKILRAEFSRHPDIRTRFLREGYVANAVGHPGVARVLDDDEAEDGAVFLVMELLEGEELGARWKRSGKRLDPGEVLSIAFHLLDVLAAAHEKDIVHRDIKPQNIFITPSGEVKVLDFGIARLNGMRHAPAALAIQTVMVIGTPGFMAPEQASGPAGVIDAQTDLWAVGATMFTLLSGRVPHHAGTMVDRIEAAMTMSPPSITTLLPDLAPPVAHVVDRALAFHKTDRWPSARAMQRAVSEAYAALQQAPAQEARESRTQIMSSPLPRADPATLVLDASAVKTALLDFGAMSRPAASPAPIVSETQLPVRRRVWMLLGGGAIAVGLLALCFRGWREPGPQPPKKAEEGVPSATPTAASTPGVTPDTPHDDCEIDPDGGAWNPDSGALDAADLDGSTRGGSSTKVRVNRQVRPPDAPTGTGKLLEDNH